MEQIGDLQEETEIEVTGNEVVVETEENEKMTRLSMILEPKNTMRRQSWRTRSQLTERNMKFVHLAAVLLHGWRIANVRFPLKFAKTSHGQVMLNPQ